MGEHEIREAFAAFDVEGCGSVDCYEVEAALKALGLPFQLEEIVASMREQGCDDPEQGDRVGFEAFSAILMQQYRAQDPLDATLRAFHLFDRRKRGKISFEDLK